MNNTCADLWGFSQDDISYAVHGCVDLGAGAFCFSTVNQQIICPQSILQPNSLPGCQPSSFSFDDIRVYGCISALNLQLSSPGPLSADATQQILNRTSPNFPKCPLQGSLIPCPVQLEQNELIPGSNTNSTVQPSQLPQSPQRTSTISIPNIAVSSPEVNQTSLIPSSEANQTSFRSLDNKFAVDQATAQSSMPTGTVIGIGVGSAVAVLLIFFAIYLFCLRRKTKKARRFEDFDDDDHDLYSKWTKSMYKNGGGERSAFITNAVPVASPPSSYADAGVEPSVFEGKRYTAVHPYTQSHSDEIDVEVGDILQINKYFNDAWCSGTNISTGKSGMFPFALVTTED